MRVILLICIIFSQIVMAEDQVKDDANIKTYKDGNENTEDMQCKKVIRKTKDIQNPESKPYQEVVYCREKNSPEWKEFSQRGMAEGQSQKIEERDDNVLKNNELAHEMRCKFSQRKVTLTNSNIKKFQTVVYCQENPPEWKAMGTLNN